VVAILCSQSVFTEEKRHKSLQKEKHDEDALAVLSDVATADLKKSSETKTNEEASSAAPLAGVSFEISIPSTIYHPCNGDKLRSMVAFSGSVYPVSSIRVNVKKQGQHVLDLQSLRFKDEMAYVGTLYDVYPQYQARQTAPDQKIIHVLSVENYWFPHFNFFLFLSYEMKSLRRGILETTVDVDCNLSTPTYHPLGAANKMIRPKLMVNGSKSIVTTEIPLPAGLGGTQLSLSAKTWNGALTWQVISNAGWKWMNPALDSSGSEDIKPVVFHFEHESSHNHIYLIGEYRVNQSTGAVQLTWEPQTPLMLLDNHFEITRPTKLNSENRSSNGSYELQVFGKWTFHFDQKSNGFRALFP